MRKGLLVGFVSSFCVLGVNVLAQDGFQNLAHIGHDTSVRVERKDGTCEGGVVATATASFVQIRSPKQPAVTIQKSDILWVEEYNQPTRKVHDVIYSARSSWRDLMELKPAASDILDVLMKDGSKHTVRAGKIDEDGIEFSNDQQPEKIQKDLIGVVYYIRPRPLDDPNEFFREQGPITAALNPHIWVRKSGLVPRLAVRMYDSARPQDAPLPDCPVKL